MEVLNSLIVENFLQNTVLNLSSFLLLCLTSFMGSFLTAAAGIGGGSLVLVTMALFLPPIILIPLHAIVQFGSNLGRTIIMKKNVSLEIFPSFLIGALLGVMFGGKMFIFLPVPVLQTVLATFILYVVWGKKILPTKPKKITFFWVGSFSSFVTMFVGATGPLVAPFVAASFTKRQQVVSTHALLMTVQHGSKILMFGLLGASIGYYLPLLLSMLVAGLIGTIAGKLVLNKISEKIFRILLKYVLTILALRLLYRAVSQN